MFAIKTCRLSDERTVGHLPREVSRPTKYLIDRGAKVTVTLSSSNYRKSPLFQGGFEIPCIVEITLPGSIMGHMLLKPYKNMVTELYCNPKDETIIGNFLEKNVNVNVNVQQQKKEKKSC